MKGQEFELLAQQTIGRLPSNEIAVADTRMSRRNTRIVNRAGSWWVEDLESKNGTFLNGETVDKARLTEADELRVGETIFAFVAGGSADIEPVVATAAPAAAPSFDDISIGSADDVRVKDQPLSYSRHAGETQTSMVWLRQDLGQRDGAFRILMIAGVLLFMAGLFWLVQTLVAGS